MREECSHNSLSSHDNPSVNEMEGQHIPDDAEIEKSILEAEASLAIEGLYIDEEGREWCRKLLRKEINYEEYLQYAKRKVGIKD